MAKNNDKLDEFMISEFQTITSRVLNIEQTRATRVNYYIVLVTGIFGSFVLSFQNLKDTFATSILALFLSSISLMLGVAILNECTDLAAQIVFLYRRAGRIRCWFHDKNPKVLPYLPWMPGDDTPPFRDDPGFATFVGSDSILFFGNSISASVFVYFLFYELTIYSVIVSMISALIAFILSGALQNIFLRRSRNKYERIGTRENSIHFPMAERVSDDETERLLGGK